MAKAKTPTVRMACPDGRPIQLRYFCPIKRKEIRISTGSHDRATAEQQKRELEAKLLLGIETKPSRKGIAGSPQMPWDDFREQYRKIYLSTLRPTSAGDSESRLDIAERIVQPKILADLHSRDTLESLQAKMLAGEGQPIRPRSKKKGGGTLPVKIRPRSPHTVKSNMASIVAALNWAARRGWLPAVPLIDKVKTSKIRAMKGRPITAKEFQRMLDETASIVGEEAAESWRHTLRGLWASALRLEELMNVSWDDENAIRPIWNRGRQPVLYIPAEMQKNDTEEAIPLLPWFESVLLETPEDARTGWIFNPASLQGTMNRPAHEGRQTAEWIGRIISRIGRKAGVVVRGGDLSAHRSAKYASAHDLRRSCAERLLDAGVPAEAVTRVLRHASFETTRRHYAPGDVQKIAETIRQCLGTVLEETGVSYCTRRGSNPQPPVPKTGALSN
ncbi:Site-specific recombinase XerD [Planctomicrobium piriforme]|uniref:Site-specific recombinase XerD n=1 Tax=Planctomicrobium piriforme TaxID=1576369 RepID=A0A1I3L3U9_9PLAN|nr:Site-specific recombinase XerD [Planctomicrobium piriforme]